MNFFERSFFFQFEAFLVKKVPNVVVERFLLMLRTGMQPSRLNKFNTAAFLSLPWKVRIITNNSSVFTSFSQEIINMSVRIDPLFHHIFLKTTVFKRFHVYLKKTDKVETLFFVIDQISLIVYIKTVFCWIFAAKSTLRG